MIFIKTINGGKWRANEWRQAHIKRWGVVQLIIIFFIQNKYMHRNKRNSDFESQ